MTSLSWWKALTESAAGSLVVSQESHRRRARRVRPAPGDGLGAPSGPSLYSSPYVMQAFQPRDLPRPVAGLADGRPSSEAPRTCSAMCPTAAASSNDTRLRSAATHPAILGLRNNDRNSRHRLTRSHRISLRTLRYARSFSLTGMGARAKMAT
jgi:hypothetical protein